jgi:hypothetical protein
MQTLENLQKKSPKKINDTNQLVLQATCSEDGSKHGITDWRFDPEMIREAFTEMVISDELPFAFSDRPGFKKFVSKACQRFFVPTRRTTTRDVVAAYNIEKEKLKKVAELITLHPTAHIFFHEVAEFIILLCSWCESSDPLRKELAKRILLKYNKYWCDHTSFNIFIFVDVALDPRYKLSNYTKIATLEMFGEVKGEEVWKQMTQTLTELFEEYEKKLRSNQLLAYCYYKFRFYFFGPISLMDHGHKAR